MSLAALNRKRFATGRATCGPTRSSSPLTARLNLVHLISLAWLFCLACTLPGPWLWYIWLDVASGHLKLILADACACSAEDQVKIYPEYNLIRKEFVVILDG